MVATETDGHSEADNHNDDEETVVAALITRILLEHFGDGQPVHADVVMDTVQYRLAREETMAAAMRRRMHRGDDGREYCYYDEKDDGGRGGRVENYCVWADGRVSRAYHACLLRLVRSGRVRVVYDCARGCGGCREDGSPRCCAIKGTQTARMISKNIPSESFLDI